MKGPIKQGRPECKVALQRHIAGTPPLHWLDAPFDAYGNFHLYNTATRLCVQQAASRAASGLEIH